MLPWNILYFTVFLPFEVRSIILAAVPSVSMRPTNKIDCYTRKECLSSSVTAVKLRYTCGLHTLIGSPCVQQADPSLCLVPILHFNLFEQVILFDLVSHCPNEIYSSGFQNHGSEPSSTTSGDQKRVRHDSVTFIVILMIKCQPVQMRRDSRAVHRGELVCNTLLILYTVFVSSQVHFI